MSDQLPSVQQKLELVEMKPTSMVLKRNGYWQGSPAHSWEEISFHLIEHRHDGSICDQRCMARHIYGRDNAQNRRMASNAVRRVYARFRDDRKLAERYQWNFPIAFYMPVPVNPEEPEGREVQEEKFMLVGSDAWQIEIVEEIKTKRLDRLADTEQQLGNLHHLLRRLRAAGRSSGNLISESDEA